MEEKTNGFVKISEDVISSIAVSAAKEIDGVSKVFTKISANIKNTVPSAKPSQKGVSLVSTPEGLELTLRIAVNAGCKIGNVCADVQKNVLDAVSHMTGIKVAKVNVIAASLTGDEEK